MPSISQEELVQAAENILGQAESERRRSMEENYNWSLELASGYSRELAEAGEDEYSVLLPDVEDFLRSVTSGVKNSLRAAKPYPDFEVMSTDPVHNAIANALGKIIRYDLEESGFYDKIKSAVYFSMLAGLSSSKVNWELKEYIGGIGDDGKPIKDYEGGLSFDNIDPMNFWVDPSGLNHFYIERKEVTLDELKANAEEMGLINLDDVQANEARSSEYANTYSYLGQIDTSSVRRPEVVEIHEFCGRLYTPKGDLLVENGSMIIANRKVLIKAPTEYPYLHGEKPYCVLNPLNIVQSGYPRSILWGILDLTLAISHLFNIGLNTARLSIPIIAYQEGTINTDPEDFSYGVYPGKPIATLGRPSESIGVMQTGANPMIVQQFMASAQQQLQSRNAGLVQAGLPSGRGRQSATEVMVAQQMANSLIGDIMDGMTSSYLNPLFRKAVYLIAQYRTEREWQSPKWQWVLGKDYEPFMQAVEENKLWEVLHLLRVKSEEPIDAATRQTTAETIMALFKLFAQFGAGYLKMPLLMQDLAKKLGIDPQKYISDEMNWEQFAQSLARNGQLGQVMDVMGMAGAPPEAMQAMQGGGMQEQSQAVPPGMGGSY